MNPALFHLQQFNQQIVAVNANAMTMSQVDALLFGEEKKEESIKKENIEEN